MAEMLSAVQSARVMWAMGCFGVWSGGVSGRPWDAAATGCWRSVLVLCMQRMEAWVREAAETFLCCALSMFARDREAD